MDYKEMYESWINNPYFDEDTIKELKDLNRNDAEIQDRFYRDLEFGTRRFEGSDRSRNE